MKILYFFMDICLHCILFLTCWMAAIIGMAVFYYVGVIPEFIVLEIEIPLYIIISIIMAVGFFDEQIRETPINSKSIVYRCVSFIEF